MAKTAITICLTLLIIGCRKEKECLPKPTVQINPAFIKWIKPYSDNKTLYIKFKSNKGPEESLIVSEGGVFKEWHFSTPEYCYVNKGEWKTYSLTSSIYKKWFDVSVMQYSLTETMVSIVNRSGVMEVGAIVFSSDNSYYLKNYPCDTCVKYLNNYTINNKAYEKVIKLYCPTGAISSDPEIVKEIYMAEGYGIVKYVCSDSTIWTIVN